MLLSFLILRMPILLDCAPLLASSLLFVQEVNGIVSFQLLLQTMAVAHILLVLITDQRFIHNVVCEFLNCLFLSSSENRPRIVRKLFCGNVALHR